jgi:hypothetical protein
MRQGQELSLNKHLGGGSKWRARLILLLVLLGMLLGTWFRFREIPEGYRALILAALIGCSYLFVVFKRKWSKADRRPTKLDIVETGLTILGPSSLVTLPWSAFRECLESADLFVLVDRPMQTLFVIPKRAFPSETWQTWFREQANNGARLPTPIGNEPPSPTPSMADCQVKLTFKLGLRDYFDRTLASCITWGICLGLAGLLVGTSLYSAANPPPNPVNSNTKVFFMFVCPFYLVCVTMVIVIFSVHGWLNHAKYNSTQEVGLSEASLEFAGTDGSGTIAWTTFKHYKETLWSFIIWRGSQWAMLPKRAFASWDDINKCRELLDCHLQRSRWFRG